MEQTKTQNNVDLFGLGWIYFDEAREIYASTGKHNGKPPLEEVITPRQLDEIEAQAFFHTFRRTHLLTPRPSIEFYLPTKQELPSLTEYQVKLATLYRLVDTAMVRSEGEAYTIGGGSFDLDGSFHFDSGKISARLAIRNTRFGGSFFYIDVDNYGPNTRVALKTYKHGPLFDQLKDGDLFSKGPINFLVPAFLSVLPVRGVTEIADVLGTDSCVYDKGGKRGVTLSLEDYTL